MLPVRVMIVDDHEAVLSVLPVVLSMFDDIEVVATASSGTVALRLCQEHHPQVILMDIHMPEMSGVEATRLIQSDCTGAKVIALTASMEEQDIQAMYSAGAIDYIPKNVDADAVAEAIRRAAA